MTIIVTGAAGFIGHALCKRLLSRGESVVGIDALTDYYSVDLKRARLATLSAHRGFSFHKADITDAETMPGIGRDSEPRIIYHLAAQAGVRHSLEFPRTYVDANVSGSFNVIDMAREMEVEHLILASTSSAYGAARSETYSETDPANHPLTVYAATKRASELIAHSHSHLYDIPTTVARFFTVFGPWGRPDMAYWLFTEAILNGRPIDVFGGGETSRDYTYIDDLVDALVALGQLPPRRGIPVSSADTLSPVAPFRTVNLGGSRPVPLSKLISEIERNLGRVAKKRHLPMQPGDMRHTRADTRLLSDLTGLRFEDRFDEGVAAFVEWFLNYSGETAASL